MNSKIKEILEEVINRHRIVGHNLTSVDVEKSKLDWENGKRMLKDIVIAGVDGGASIKEFFACSVVLWRAVGILFQYKEGKINAVHYIPNKSPDINYKIVEHSYDASTELSLLRSIEEKNVAKNMLVNEEIDILFLDGSILPHPSHKTCQNKTLIEQEEKLIKELCQLALKKDVCVCGIVKDTNSWNLGKQFGLDMKDVIIANEILEEGEALKPYPIDFDGLAILNTFIKVQKNEFPVRIEMVNGGEHEIDMTYFLCKLTKTWAQPPVLVEADFRAKISSKHPLMIMLEHEFLYKRRERRYD